MTEQTIDQLHDALNDAIEEGDLGKMDEVARLISEQEQGSGGDTTETTEETNVADGEEPDDAASRSEGEDGGKPKEEDEKKPEGVMSKKGDHILPYSTVEEAREAEREAKQKAADLEEQIKTMRENPEIPAEVQEQLTRMTRLVDNYEAQFKSSGMEPKPLPEEFKLDAEKLKELEEYGTVGEMAAALARQNEYLLDQIKDIRASTTKQPSKPVDKDNDPSAVVASNPDLTRWAKSDYAWNKMSEIDAYVQTLPEFVGKSLSERANEVVRRTKIELGEAAPPTKTPGKSAEEIINETSSTPTSLSEIGGSGARQEATFSEQTEGKSDLEIAQIMQERMSRGEKIDDLL